MNKPKFNHMYRKVDELGRIVLPKEIRDANGIKEGTPLQIKVTDAGLLLSLPDASCVFCHDADDLIDVDGVLMCKTCAEKISKANAKSRRAV